MLKHSSISGSTSLISGSTSSRIRTIFIGFWATVLAGVVLIYFGFTSISKQRLALEQVVVKTYRESMASLVRRIEQELLAQETQLVEEAAHASKAVSSDVDRGGSRLRFQGRKMHEALRSLRRESRLVDQIFLLDGERNPIFPRLRRKSDFYHPSGIQWKDQAAQVSFERGRDWELVRNDPEQAIEFYREALARSSSPRRKAVLLSHIGRCYFKLGGYRPALQVYGDLLSICEEDQNGGYLDPVGLNLRAVAGDRIGACYEHLGEDRKAFEGLLDLYRGLLEDRWDMDEDQALFFRPRTKAHLGALTAKIPEASEERARLDNLGRMEREIEEERSFLSRLQGGILSQLRLEAEEGSGGGSELRHFYRELEDGPHQIAYCYLADPDAAGGRGIWGFEINLGYVREEVVGKASKGMDLAVEIVDGTGRSSEDYLVQVGFGEGVLPWKLGVSRAHASSIDELAKRQMILYAGIISAAVLAMAAGMFFTFRGVGRELEMARMKSDFVSNVSHELKTPLALIRMYGETLEMGRISDEAMRREYLKVITKESERLTHMIDNVLDFSRLDAGKKEYHFQIEDLAHVIRETVEAYRFHVERRGFKFGVEVSEDIPPCRIDRDAIAQALTNLLSNAEKYSREIKEIEVHAEARDGEVTIQVADKGVGISPEDQERIFDKFHRVRDRSVQQTGGSGLGLSLVKHIVEAHGGRLSVESQIGKGSRFTLTIPVALDLE